MSTNKQVDQTQATRYQAAHDEWSRRIGNARSQARNWRLACLCSLVVVFLLVIALIVLLNKQKSYVYVAEVKPQENIVNLHSVDKSYQPSQAQEEYFVGRFITRIMTLPLDPVVVRNNWMKAYASVNGRAKGQLNDYARKHNPFKDIGQLSRVVKVQNYHPIGQHSYEFTWTQTTYNQQGKIQDVTLYNGVFTVKAGTQPKTAAALLQNPLGLKIVYFSMTNEGHSQ